MTGDIHVIPHDLEWAIVVEGTHDITVYESREAAVAIAFEVAKEQNVELLVHGCDGQVIAQYASVHAEVPWKQVR